MPTCQIAASRLARTLRIALLTAVSAFVLAATLGTAAASAATTMPAEGIFEGCQLNTQMQTCLQRLQVMHDGGFQVVVFPANDGSLADLATYDNAAHSLGMSVMWALSDPGWWQGSSVTDMFGNFSAACGCSDNATLLSYTAHYLGSLPATYGYYAADDSMLTSGDTAGVARYTAAIKAADPNPSHTILISSNSADQANQFKGLGDLNGTEIYPVQQDSMLPVASNQSMWDGVGQSAIDGQHLADSVHQASAFILQAFTFGDNLDDGEAVGACTLSMTKLQCAAQLHYPAPAAQLELRNEVLKNAHPKLILWWSFQGTYGQAGNDTYSLYPTGQEAADRWAGLTAAVKAPAPTTMTSADTATTTAHTAAATHKTHKKARKAHKKAKKSAHKTTRKPAHKTTRKPARKH